MATTRAYNAFRILSRTRRQSSQMMSRSFLTQCNERTKFLPCVQCANTRSQRLAKDEKISHQNIAISRYFSTHAEEEDVSNVHIISESEAVHGGSEKHEFMAETRQLLDIVARSLYSEKEVFIREIVSNSSDALEKLRHFQVTGGDLADESLPLEIHLSTDEDKRLFIIQDFGVGMTQEELINNLGTIARSGSKAFMENVDEKDASAENIIGQFGVGFYSTFMVGDKIDVYTKSHKPGSEGLYWTSDGVGSYEISKADGVLRGTKVVIHLKEDDKRFSLKATVEDIIKRYSNFVSFPIFLNGTQLNTIRPLWTQSERDVTQEDHEKFYQFISNTSDSPRYSYMFKADAPLSISSVFYVPTNIPEVFGFGRMEPEVSLYSRKILIQSKAKQLVPEWLRFIRGVVDSEDIPLNLSRELLQDSALIRKLSEVVVAKILRFLQDQAKKDEDKFQEFVKTCGNYFREGVVVTESPSQREEIAKLLRFESSAGKPGELKGLLSYIKDMKDDQKEIFYIYAPNRELAESSPYYEALKAKEVEVLFTYEEADEVVMAALKDFSDKPIVSAENFLVKPEEKESEDSTSSSNEEGTISGKELDELMSWIQNTLGKDKVHQIKSSTRIASHPAMITVPDMGAARRWLKFVKTGPNAEMINMKYDILQPQLEINPSHEIIKSLNILKRNNPFLADLVAQQLFDNAMITAGLMDNPVEMVGRLNSLLSNVMTQVTAEDTKKKSTIIQDF